jgi:RimJ/RimL family protein N-acetyltransferase
VRRPEPATAAAEHRGYPRRHDLPVPVGQGARAVLDHAFGVVGRHEIVSVTVPANWPPQRMMVMQKLGMHRGPAGDVEHPNVAAGDPLRRHDLYRLARPEDVVGS